MAKTTVVKSGAETAHPAKKATKKAVTKLSFIAGDPVIKETLLEASKDDVIDSVVIVVEDSAKKEIVEVSQGVVYDMVVAPTETAKSFTDQPIQHLAQMSSGKEAHNAITNAKVGEGVVKSDRSILPVEKVQQDTPVKPSYHNNGNKPFNKDAKSSGPHFSKKEELPASGLYPEHMVEIALIIKNNAEIRRFTALGILNYLLQKGEIKGDKRYVSFKWNKFTVKFDSMVRDYSYAEAFFLNCLVASFGSFGASAQRTIDNFTFKELNKSLSEIASQDEIDAITESTSKR